jgi:hypothetical protein
MRGLLADVWGAALAEVWTPLFEEEGAPRDLFATLYPDFAKALRPRPSDDEILTVSNDAELARERFFATQATEFASESTLARFWENAFNALQEIGQDSLVVSYCARTKDFLDRYNLRYRLIAPYRIVPRLPALFGSMIEEVELQISGDPHLLELHRNAEEAFEDLSLNARPVDIKNCISRVCTFVEGLAARRPEVTANTLGAAANQLTFWPHATIRNVLSSLYGFCSDYPAIRHAGNPEGRLRELELGDALIISTAILVFTGYLTDVNFEDLLGVRTAE